MYPCPREIIPVLDIAKVADLIVFVMDVNEGVDDTGHKIIHLLNCQGMPTPMGAILVRFNLTWSPSRHGRNQLPHSDGLFFVPQ
jgi:hypothetical protein